MKCCIEAHSGTYFLSLLLKAGAKVRLLKDFDKRIVKYFVKTWRGNGLGTGQK
jgi:hypothetical protein